MSLLCFVRDLAQLLLKVFLSVLYFSNYIYMYLLLLRNTFIYTFYITLSSFTFTEKLQGLHKEVFIWIHQFLTFPPICFMALIFFSEPFECIHVLSVYPKLVVCIFLIQTTLSYITTVQLSKLGIIS